MESFRAGIRERFGLGGLFRQAHRPKAPGVLEGIALSGTLRDDDAVAEYSPPAFSMSGAAEWLQIRS